MRDDEAIVVVQMTPRQELERILSTLATKEDLKAFATKMDLNFATKAELREEGERTRTHFNVVAERIEESVRLIAEGHGELDRQVTALERAAKRR